MATPRYTWSKELAWLRKVDQQIQTAQTTDRSARMAAMHWSKRAEDLRALATYEKYATLSLDDAADTLDKLVEVMNPQAGMAWRAEQVQACVERLRSFITLGLADNEEQIAEANDLIGRYANVKKVREASTPIEGRPARVRVVGPAGEKIAEMTTNTTNGPGNLRARIVGWLESHNITLSDAQRELIKQAVYHSVINNQPVVALGDFGTLVHVQ